MDTEQREAIRKKMAALRDRTTDRGFTEAEAMTAAEMLNKLSAQYGLTMSDLEISEERSGLEYLVTGRKRLHEIVRCVQAIATFTDCKCWTNAPGKYGNYTPYKRIAVFGQPEDVQNFMYLYHVIKAAMDNALTIFKIRSKYLGDPTDRSSSHSFLLGMARRVSERLREMKRAERDDTHKTTGRDLVVVKRATVDRDFAKLGICLGRVSGNTTSRNDTAYGAGKAAGDRVGLHRGVSSGGQGGPRLIGNG